VSGPGGAVARRVLAGYVAVPAQAGPAAADGLVSAWRNRFAAHADRHGYQMGPVFTDVRGHTEHGLYRLAEYLRQDCVVDLVVPDLEHLTHARCLAGADRRIAQRYLRAAVLTVDTATTAAPVGGGARAGRG
jgi:hypothetical protein